MLTLDTLNGSSRLGWREKSLLLLMLKGDNPPGEANFIWLDIYKTFNISYSLLAKNRQLEKFQEERKFRLSMHRLTQQGLVKPVLSEYQVDSSPDPRGYGYNQYRLTMVGRVVAEKLQQEKKQQNLQEDLEKTIVQLKAAGQLQVTLGQVREQLWQLSQNKFKDREEFDQYWNSIRLGRRLKSYVCRRSRVSGKDGRRKYYLRV